MTQEATRSRPLDRIDLKILRALQDNARLSYVELAQIVGLSTTPCMERVKRLENSRVIQGYHAKLNSDALGLELLVFLEITLASQSPEAFAEFRKATEKLAFVQECHLISGQSDYLLKVRLTDLKSYRKHLGELLLALTTRSRIKESHRHGRCEANEALPLDLVSHRFRN
ncbi:AsnC family transcriptional regulator [Reinekea blandensis]|uniref:Leucine-responsive regulatory protein n=1 Tax=Reinekea blandensis MED297 TaxID=314283 RepID=A4BDB0_9GAMM|nr:leucine responsive regulatory protein [Reinekea sp. MED297] [Reinekea blandensis MED297]